MNRTARWSLLCLVSFLCVEGGQAQQRPVSDDEASRQGRGLLPAVPQSPSRAAQAPRELVPTQPVPRLVKFAGTLKDAQGKPLSNTVGLTFAIYKDQEGGAPLWLETQNVELDELGHYTVLLGATKSEGLPLELFTSGESRWLGVRVQLPGEVEQPRVLLVSVPYALKAVDAETLGGMPASAFVLAQPTGTASGAAGASSPGATVTGTNSKTGGKAKGTAKTAAAAAPVAANFIPVFLDNAGTLGSSVMAQSGSFIGVGTTSPAAALHVNGDTLLVTSATTAQVQFSGALSSARFGQDGSGAFFASDTPGKAVRFYTNNGTLNEGLRIDSSSNVGIGTTTPAAKLDVAGNINSGGNLTIAGGVTAATMGMNRNPTPNTAGNSLAINAGGATSGATDKQGGDLLLSAGNGTGLGGSGNARIQTAGPAAASGTSDDTLVDRYIIVSKAKAMTLASPGFTALLSIHLVGTNTAGGRVRYTVRATDGGSQVATESGVIQYLATANSVTCTVSADDKLHLGTVNSGCTPGFFNPGSQPGISIFDNVSFPTPAAIVVHEVYFTIENESGSSIRLEP